MLDHQQVAPKRSRRRPSLGCDFLKWQEGQDLRSIPNKETGSVPVSPQPANAMASILISCPAHLSMPWEPLWNTCFINFTSTISILAQAREEP
jgi:hypothetical protein